MGEKLLVQMRASDKGDPAFDTQVVREGDQNTPFRKFFSVRGIKMAERDFVSSCHGCTDLDLKYARQMQVLADQGHKVGFISTGSLYFAKPSLNAANAPTVPGISVPLEGGMFGGADAFLAPMLPSGTAVIGGVGIGNYTTAAHFMATVLGRELPGVYVRSHGRSDKLIDALEGLGVKILDYVDEHMDGLVVCDEVCLADIRLVDRLGGGVIFAAPKLPASTQVFDFMRQCPDLQKSVWVRGPENVAYFAAKCLAAYHPEIAANLKAAAKKKAGSYEQRDLTLESFV